MISLQAILPNSFRFQEIEFSSLLGWALLFPAKRSYLYYLGFTCLLAVFLLRKIFSVKSIAWSRFSLFLLALNALLVFSAFFSPHPFRSFLFVADILLLSLWFLFFYIEKSDMDRYLRLLALVCSASSLVVVVAFAFRGHGPAAQIFANPILQGIVSALAALFFLHSLLSKYGHADLAWLALNAGAVVLSASKAAFLGLVVFAAVMIFRGKRLWLAYLGGSLVLLLVVPNPLRRMVDYSLHRDPYVLDRLDIWNMSARMFRKNLLAGVGPDLFDEAARRFNFPQEKGASRYGKLPESPHSDYWKVITENGLPGLLFVFVALFLAIRGMLSPPWSPLSKWLLAFLLTQMLVFNFVFNSFFLLVFLLLVQDRLSEPRHFTSVSPGSRGVMAALLLVALSLFYLFPFVADRCLEAAAAESDIPKRYALVERAAFFSPLDERAPLARSGVLGSFARSAASAEAFCDAVESLHRAQELSRNDTEGLQLEASLFREFLGKGAGYPALAEEVLAPLRRAEDRDPFNPFLKLQQAIVLGEFGHREMARRQGVAALALEPEYVAAILFVRDLDGLPFHDPVLLEKLSRIQAKAKALGAKPGSYLFRLFQMPANAAER